MDDQINPLLPRMFLKILKCQKDAIEAVFANHIRKSIFHEKNVRAGKPVRHIFKCLR